jgi:hypothetical protein
LYTFCHFTSLIDSFHNLIYIYRKNVPFFLINLNNSSSFWNNQNKIFSNFYCLSKLSLEKCIKLLRLFQMFHVFLYNNDSILNGLIGLRFVVWSTFLLISIPLGLVRCFIEQSSGSSSDSPPTTSIVSLSSLSSSSSSSSSPSVSDALMRCWERYSFRRASKSTVIPLARSLRA